MGWMLIIIPILVVWVASLCKIFLAPSSHSNPTFLNNGPAFQKRNVLLVVAHPDDESMFFSPTISYLTSRGHNLYLLCLSVGNADGLGSIRKDELYRACAVHKVQLQQVKVLDHPDLQDGFGLVWNHDLLAKIIAEEVHSHGIDVLITFDSYGISGHCNHRDVHYGVRKFLLDSSPRNIEAWELVSINILRKYSGPLDIWLSNLESMRHPRGTVHWLLSEHPRKSFLAMAQHSSQWVWFRKLFVAFSSYTYVNTLRKIK
ncbi:N-acetylglucosaminyl phosphatidylinositol deacetylase [Corchorus olitorius]|uniref:N-acetylglucosaminylphosphatidylinositol deacetylase n=1 Tax=Corchorus olitorius TaxID=93759 RepID=A0A1R3JTZ1_9ROSI|nr:N-acetylglucosaminyl phosphatidylinositol deacetylase [Corchorus olitorius]